MSDIEEIAISKFKATCLAVLERVRRTGRPVRVTRFGKPVAEIVSPKPTSAQSRKLGFMEGQLGAYGDIVGPMDAFDDGAMLRKWDDLNAPAKAPRRRRRARI